MNVIEDKADMDFLGLVNKNTRLKMKNFNTVIVTSKEPLKKLPSNFRHSARNQHEIKKPKLLLCIIQRKVSSRSKIEKNQHL